MNFKDLIEESIRRWLEDELNEGPLTVVSYKEDKESVGKCDTCYTEFVVVTITYIDSNDKEQVYKYDGGFIKLLEKVLEY